MSITLEKVLVQYSAIIFILVSEYLYVICHTPDIRVITVLKTSKSIPIIIMYDYLADTRGN